jgi:hypothetical protein
MERPMTDPIPEVPYSFEPDDLVVHLPHVDLVRATLGKLGIEVAGTPEPDPLLDLTLLKLSKPITDDLLKTLREQLVSQHGWCPLFGKNRHLENVVGMPQPRSMNANDPIRANPPPPIPFSAAGRGVRIGVLDTKIYAHPDLIGRFVAEPDSIYGPFLEPVPSRAGHATFIASLITGLAPAAVVDARAVLNDNGKAKSWDTAKAMIRFADAGIDILNLSLGLRTADHLPPLLMSRVVELLSQKMLIVAAAGNHGELNDPDLRKAPTWPAALPDVVAVGARDDHDNLSSFSPKLPWVTCTAPGEHLVGAYLNAIVKLTDDTTQQFAGYATWKGTSFATAKVSGAIAAVMKQGKVTAREALELLFDEPDGVVRRYV